MEVIKEKPKKVVKLKKRLKQFEKNIKKKDGKKARTSLDQALKAMDKQVAKEQKPCKSKKRMVAKE